MFLSSFHVKLSCLLQSMIENAIYHVFSGFGVKIFNIENKKMHYK